MRTIERTTAFKRDYKREAKGPHRTDLDTVLLEIIGPLANDEALPDRCRDHALSGGWKHYRDCHVRPDLVLIYPAYRRGSSGPGPPRLSFGARALIFLHPPPRLVVQSGGGGPSPSDCTALANAVFTLVCVVPLRSCD